MDEFHYYGDPDRGWAWQVPLLLLSRAQFVLMSATLGDVTAIADDLSRRTGRPTARITGVERPVPLHFSYARTPVHETVEELLADRAGAGVHRALLAGRRDGAGAGAVERSGSSRREQRDAIAEAIGGFRFTTAFGTDAVALRARGHRRAPRRDAAALPAARRDARAARAAARDLRHRHPRRRHQRADPDGADHRAGEIRRAADAAAQRPRVPPDRRARGPGRVRHGRNRRRAWRPSTRSRTQRGRQGGRRPEEAQEDRAQEGARRAS